MFMRQSHFTQRISSLRTSTSKVSKCYS